MRANIAAIAAITLALLTFLISYNLFEKSVARMTNSLLLAIIAMLVGFFVLLPVQIRRVETILERTEVELGESGKLLLTSIATGANDLESLEIVTGLPESIISNRVRMLEILGLVETKNGEILLSKYGNEYFETIKSLEGGVWKKFKKYH